MTKWRMGIGLLSTSRDPRPAPYPPSVLVPRSRPLLMRISARGAVSLLLAAACVSDGANHAAVVREQRGDTLVIRIGGEGAWGNGARLTQTAALGDAEGNDTTALGQIIALAIGTNGGVYATDRQRLAVRVFDATLQPIALWGRAGSGPAELRNPDGGLAVFSDGRVAVRDPGNARMQIFARDGSAAGEWRVVDAGLRTRDNFGVQGDTLLSRVVVRADGPIDSWEYGLVRIAPTGEVLDTLATPAASAPRPTLVARRARLSFDVFTAPGEFLGTLAIPTGLQMRPQPVFSVDGVVGLTLDEAGVPRIVRYRVETSVAR